jgi:hypothetical protein
MRRTKRQRGGTGAALLALAGGLLAGCGNREPGPAPVFCYRTLADVACYDRPDPGREGRLVGVYLRARGDLADRWRTLAAAPMSR